MKVGFGLRAPFDVPVLVSKGAAACEPGLDHVLALAEPEPPPAALSAGRAHRDGLPDSVMCTAACFAEKKVPVSQ